jgi:D-alanyl-lipoteichoic acid acyltransferase DltB (MBOAT superfamily)
MLLGGLWHGASWTFVIWGAIHGGAIASERFVKSRYRDWRTAHTAASTSAPAPYAPSPAAAWAASAAGLLITFHVFTLSAIFFRAPDLGTATRYFTTMASFNGGPDLFTPFLLLLTAGSVAVQFLPGGSMERIADKVRDHSATALGLALGGGLLLLGMIGPEGVAPFVYFQF